MVDKRKKKRMLKKKGHVSSNDSESSVPPVVPDDGGGANTTTDQGSGNALARKANGHRDHARIPSTPSSPEGKELMEECVEPEFVDFKMSEELLSSGDVESLVARASPLMTLARLADMRERVDERDAASTLQGDVDDRAVTPGARRQSVEEMLIDFSDDGDGCPMLREIIVDGGGGSGGREDREDIISTSYDDDVQNSLPEPIPPLMSVKNGRMGENERLMLEHFSSSGSGGGGKMVVCGSRKSASTTVVYSSGRAPISSPIVTPTAVYDNSWVKDFLVKDKEEVVVEAVETVEEVVVETVESVFETYGEPGDGDLLDYCVMDVDGAVVETSEVKPESVVEIAPVVTLRIPPPPSVCSKLSIPRTDTDDIASRMKAALDRIMAEKASCKVEVTPRIIEVPTSCAVKNCKKKPTHKCPACDVTMYCSRKHQRIFAKEHELRCNGFRVIDSYKYGKHAIAARDFKMVGEFVMCDEPVIMLPLNPSLLESGGFSVDYCVQCFTDHSLSDGSEMRGWACGTRLCPKGCGMRICRDRLVCERALSNIPYPQRIPSHFDNECKYLREAVKRVFHKSSNLPVSVDQSFIGLLRFMRLYNAMDRGGGMSSNGPILRMFESVSEAGPTSHFLRSKVMMLRELFMVDERVVGDDEARRIELVLEKFGRNVGVDCMVFSKEFYAAGGCGRKSVKCVYPLVGFITHSCTPNSVLQVKQGYSVAVHTLQELSKGEQLTVCYDDRILFWPAWKRREYLSDEFGFVCKCKRCSSESELGSFFSGFPCQTDGCSDMHSFSVQTATWGPWSCLKCKGGQVSHEDAITEISWVGSGLERVRGLGDPISFLVYLSRLVEMGYLHWGSWLVFENIVQLFRMVWERMSGGDGRVIGWFSESRGLELVGVADVLINLSFLFLPHGYLDSHVLPLRLAAIIKLRTLINDFKASQTDIPTIDETVHEIYFRAAHWSGLPLYERACSNSTLEVVEMKMLMELKAAGVMKKGSGLLYLERMYKFKAEKDPDLVRVVEGGNRDREESDAFPWNLRV